MNEQPPRYTFGQLEASTELSIFALWVDAKDYDALAERLKWAELRLRVLGEITNCPEVVMLSDYNALDARLAEAEKLLRVCAMFGIDPEVSRQVHNFLRAEDTTR